MVNGALSIGGIVGVLLSGAFVYFEIGRFAAPQVPRTLFDERRELFAYTAGLFVGVPIAFVFLLLESATANGAFISAIIDIAIVAAAAELAQWVLGKSRYFGGVPATPFYAVGLRAGIGAILILAAVTSLVGAPTLSWETLALAGAQSVALLAIQVNGGLQSIQRSRDAPKASGGPLAGLLVGVAAFAVLTLGLSVNPLTGAAAALLVVGGLLPSYRRLRRRVLEAVGEPSAPPSAGGSFGRTDAKEP